VDHIGSKKHATRQSLSHQFGRESKGENEKCIFLGGPERIKAIFSKAERNVPRVIFLNNINVLSWLEIRFWNGKFSQRFQLLAELNM